jgi:hypothetical protein
MVWNQASMFVVPIGQTRRGLRLQYQLLAWTIKMFPLEAIEVKQTDLDVGRHRALLSLPCRRFDRSARIEQRIEGRCLGLVDVTECRGSMLHRQARCCHMLVVGSSNLPRLSRIPMCSLCRSESGPEHHLSCMPFLLATAKKKNSRKVQIIEGIHDWTSPQATSSNRASRHAAPSLGWKQTVEAASDPLNGP